MRQNSAQRVVILKMLVQRIYGSHDSIIGSSSLYFTTMYCTVNILHYFYYIYVLVHAVLPTNEATLTSGVV